MYALSQPCTHRRQTEVYKFQCYVMLPSGFPLQFFKLHAELPPLHYILYMRLAVYRWTTNHNQSGDLNGKFLSTTHIVTYKWGCARACSLKSDIALSLCILVKWSLCMETSHHSFLQIVHLFNTYLIRSQVSTYMYLAAHIENVELYQDNAPWHTTRSTLLEIDVLGFQRAIHQPY